MASQNQSSRASASAKNSPGGGTQTIPTDPSATASPTKPQTGSGAQPQKGASAVAEHLSALEEARKRFVGQTKARQSFEAAQKAAAENGKEPPAEEPKGEEPESAGKEKAGEIKNTYPQDTRYERARRALLRIGMTDEDLKKLDREKVTRRGLKLARLLDSSASEHDELDRLRKGASAPKEGQSSPSAKEGAPQSRVPASELARRLAEPFTKDDPELGKEVAGAFEKAIAPLLSEIDKLKDDLAQKSSAEDSEGKIALIEAARAKLKDRYSDLADDDEFDEIAEMMVGFVDLPRLRSLSASERVEQAMEMACIANGLVGGVAEHGRAGDSPRRGASAGRLDTSAAGERGAESRSETEKARDLFVKLGGSEREKVLASLGGRRY